MNLLRPATSSGLIPQQHLRSHAGSAALAHTQPQTQCKPSQVVGSVTAQSLRRKPSLTTVGWLTLRRQQRCVARECCLQPRKLGVCAGPWWTMVAGGRQRYKSLGPCSEQLLHRVHVGCCKEGASFQATCIEFLPNTITLFVQVEHLCGVSKSVLDVEGNSHIHSAGVRGLPCCLWVFDKCRQCVCR